MQLFFSLYFFWALSLGPLEEKTSDSLKLLGSYPWGCPFFFKLILKPLFFPAVLYVVKGLGFPYSSFKGFWPLGNRSIFI